MRILKMDTSHQYEDDVNETSLALDHSGLTDVTPNVSMDTNTSRDSDTRDRKYIELDLNPRYNTVDDPIDRFEPICGVLHRLSPLQGIMYVRLTAEHSIKRKKQLIWRAFLTTLVVLFICYLGVAISHKRDDEGFYRLIGITCFTVFCVAYHYIKKKYGAKIYDVIVRPVLNETFRYHRFITTLLTLTVASSVIWFLIIDTTLRRPKSLISMVGIVVFVTLMFFFSKDPRQVTWRPVLWGLLLQIIFALIVLRTQWGYAAFVWLGKRVTDYLDFTNAGSEFVFGGNFRDHFFAFSVMPVIIFFSATISVLYYLGLIQLLIEKIAFIMKLSLGTGAMESLHAAINIFVGWAEAVTLVRPLLDKMSLSELHTVMTNGFATVAGSTLAVYILFGAPANHLLSASVMSAPAALAMSKLFYPESKENRERKRKDECKISRTGHGIIDAASTGAVGAISIVAYILASVIAFFSLLEFVNATLQWFGERVGLSPPDYPPLSFELICSYLFWPVAFLMGVVPEDCRIVARMVGVKTFINEFLAYEDLGRVRRNRQEYLRLTASGINGTWFVDGGGNYVLQGSNLTLPGGVISAHSEMVATYALCGFSNVVALGIMIGALTAVAPSRKEDIVGVSIRALISGCVACFLTACVAGLIGES